MFRNQTSAVKEKARRGFSSAATRRSSSVPARSVVVLFGLDEIMSNLWITSKGENRVQEAYAHSGVKDVALVTPVPVATVSFFGQSHPLTCK